MLIISHSLVGYQGPTTICLQFFRSKAFSGSRCHCRQVSVDLGGRASQDQIADGPLGNLDVLERAHDVDLGVSQHYPSLGHVFDGVLGTAVFAGQPPDGSGQVVAFQALHVCHFERVEEKVVKSVKNIVGLYIQSNVE